MANILITTTPLLGNIEVQRYIGPLTANVVLGVNFFSDFAASITDVFGGNSETYQSKLDSLTYDVDKLMKAKATRMGANAIIDYKLQFNEISGKGKQMFMVTATGTACVITMPKQEVTEEIGQVSYSQIRRQYAIGIYRKRLVNKQSLSEKDWENIFSLNLTELATELTSEYFRLKADVSSDFNIIAYKETFSGKYEEYLSRLSKNEAAHDIYSYISTQPDIVTELAVNHNLFDPKIVIKQIHSDNISVAVNLLRSHKDYYTKEDLADMLQIIQLLDSLPNKGSFQVAKSGLFSKKEEEMYICPNGHKNSKGTTYCNSCGLNIKGLTNNQDQIINQFKGVTSALETILK